MAEQGWGAIGMKDGGWGIYLLYICAQTAATVKSDRSRAANLIQVQSASTHKVQLASTRKMKSVSTQRFSQRALIRLTVIRQSLLHSLSTWLLGYQSLQHSETTAQSIESQ